MPLNPSSKWTHKEEADHPVDPTYNGNNIPSWWSCHKCGGEILLNGTKPPITTPAVKKEKPNAP